MSGQVVHFGIYHILGRMESLAGKMQARAIRHDDENLFSDAARLRELVAEAEASLREERRRELERDLESSIQLMQERKQRNAHLGAVGE